MRERAWILLTALGAGALATALALREPRAGEARALVQGETAAKEPGEEAARLVAPELPSGRAETGATDEPDDAPREPVVAASPESGRTGPSCCVEGIVLDPDGRRCADAIVRYSWYSERTGEPRGRAVSSAYDGTFRIRVTDTEPPAFLRVEPRARDAWTPVVLEPVAPGTSGVVLRFAAARRVELRPLDLNGDVRTPWNATASVRHLGRWFPLGVVAESRTGGSVTWTLPPETFRLSFHSDVHAPAEDLGPWEPAEVGDVLLLPVTHLPRVSGTVTVGGEPVAGARLGWVSAADESAYPRWTRIETDEQGRFELTLHASAFARVVAEHDALGTASTSVMLLGLADASGIEIDLGRPGGVTGRVRLPPGVAAEDHAMRFRRGSRRVLARLAPTGRGCGSFETALTPGVWYVEPVALADSGPRAGEPATWSTGRPAWAPDGAPYRLDVRSGEVTELELDFVSPAPHRIRGEIVVHQLLDPELLASVRKFVFCGVGEIRMPEVGLWADEPVSFAETSLDEGAFVLGVREPGEYAIGIEVNLGRDVSFRGPVFVDAPEELWRLEIATAYVCLRPPAAAPGFRTSELRFHWTGADGKTATGSFEFRKHESAYGYCAVVPAGRLDVSWARRGSEEHGTFPLLVAAGEVLDVELPVRVPPDLAAAEPR